MNAVIYARYSPRPDAADCLSIDTQLERCNAYCAAHHHNVVSTHNDVALSGGRADNRPGLQDALDAACQHQAVLVVYSLSRLARNVRDAIEISERLNTRGAQLASLHERLDTTSAMGRFLFAVMAALGALEREQISERTSDAMQRHQSAGLRMSRYAPYGYRIDPDHPRVLIEDETEQVTVREILAMRADGMTTREIAAQLQINGIHSRGGGSWCHTTIASVIKKNAIK